MAEYTGSIEIEHPAAEVFAFLADPRHLPHYLPTVRGVECEGGPEGVLRLTVSGEAEGHAYHDTGWLRADQGARRLDWGSESRSDYRGWLEVREVPAGTEVAVALTTTPTGAAAARLQREAGNVEHGMRLALERVLGHIKLACETRLGPLASADAATAARTFGATARVDPEI